MLGTHIRLDIEFSNLYSSFGYDGWLYIYGSFVDLGCC